MGQDYTLFSETYVRKLEEERKELLEAAKDLRDIYRAAEESPLDVSEEAWRDAQERLDAAIDKAESA